MFTPVRFSPKDGGQLLTSYSSEAGGAANYIIKRDFRRYLDREIKREGYLDLVPKPGNIEQRLRQATGNTADVTLIHMGRRPNGQVALIVGTRTTLYRFVSFEDWRYFDGDYFLSTTPAYYRTDYGVWLVIGSGFDSQGQGRRWEVVDINGYTVFNNGWDLPMTYRLEDLAVKPIYELREMGVARVGTIAEHNGVLLCGDITQLKQDYIDQLFAPVASQFTAHQAGSKFSRNRRATASNGTVTLETSRPFFTGDMLGKRIRFANGMASTITALYSDHSLNISPAITVTIPTPFYIVSSDKADYTVLASGAAFAPTDVGRMIMWDEGTYRTITGYASPSTVYVDSDQPVSEGSFGLSVTTDPYGPITDTYKLARTHHMIIWSMPNEPRRFGATCLASTTNALKTIRFARPTRSFESGQEVILFGAGVNGGNLSATILYITDDRRSAVIDQRAALTQTKDDDTDSRATVQSADVIGSILGFEQLEGDGSPVLKMLSLRDALVIYKDTGIFVATFTGEANNPWDFREIYRGSDGLFYRNTVVRVNWEGQDFHLFAGRNALYRFDLSSLAPLRVGVGIERTFFDSAQKDSDDYDIFAAVNVVTKEVFIAFQQLTGEPDNLICYDYVQDTWASSSMQITAAASVKQLGGDSSAQDMFLLGIGGNVMLYGRVDKPYYQFSGANVVYTRGGMNYDAVLRSGWESFGDSFNEKALKEYLLESGSRASTPQLVQVDLFGTHSPANEGTLLGSAPVEVGKGLIPTHLLYTYFSDQITASAGSFEIVQRTFNLERINDEGIVRK